MEKVRQVFHEMDLFTILPTLRARTKPEVGNVCGGILSILISGIFIYLFLAQFLQLLNWQQIQSIQNQSFDLKNSKTINDFFFAIGVEYPLQATYPYIRFQFFQVTMNGTNFISSRHLQKQPCQIFHISALGQEAELNYNAFNMKNKFCLKPNQDVKISQLSVSGQYKLISVQVNSCRKVTPNGTEIYTGCESVQNFTITQSQWIKYHKYFTAFVLFINTAFNPISKSPSLKYIEQARYTFTLQRGAQGYIYFSPYTVKTDMGIGPFPIEEIEEGYKLDYRIESNFEAVPYFENVNVNFIVSRKNINISRVVGKVDAVLSYAGGLVGIIMTFFSFFILSFNQYRYQLMVGEGAFNYSDQGHKMTEHDFNFLQYLKYSLFDWVQNLFCVQIKWKSCKQVDQTREEANHQLDVKLLFRKMQHFQRVTQYLISDKQKIGLFLTQPPSLQQVRKQRKIAQYYDKVIQGKAATTVEDVEYATAILNFAMSKALDSNQQSRAQLTITGSTTKRKLNQTPDISRQNILNKVLEQMKLNTDIDDVKLDSQDQKLQEQIAQSFFRMPANARKRIQEKVPIKILQRLKKKYDVTISKETSAINLQI